MNYPKFLTSSVDPQRLGLTVKGLMMMAVPVVLLIAGVANWNFGQEEVTAVVDAVVNFVIAVSTVISTFMILLGLVRKILVKFGWVEAKK